MYLHKIDCLPKNLLFYTILHVRLLLMCIQLNMYLLILMYLLNNIPSFLFALHTLLSFACLLFCGVHTLPIHQLWKKGYIWSYFSVINNSSSYIIFSEQPISYCCHPLFIKHMLLQKIGSTVFLYIPGLY